MIAAITTINTANITIDSNSYIRPTASIPNSIKYTRPNYIITNIKHIVNISNYSITRYLT